MAGLRALVTAGGTSEPIDDVRVVTNLSTGRFGAAIANALARRGVDVTLLAGPALLARRTVVDPGVRCVPFGPDGSFADLERALRVHTDPAPDLLFMAAAVSDYSPVRASGKIRSATDRLTVEMTKNPKLLATLRARCGDATWLVGFKLLSGVSTEELVAVAQRQIEAASLDMTVANDAATFEPGRHPIVLVHRDGTSVPHVGSKADMAEVVADAALAGWLARHPADTAAKRALPAVQSWPDGDVPEWVAVLAGSMGWSRAQVAPAWRVFDGPTVGQRPLEPEADPRKFALEQWLSGPPALHAFRLDAPLAAPLYPARGTWVVGDPSPAMGIRWARLQAQFAEWLHGTSRPAVLGAVPIVNGSVVIGLVATVDVDGPAHVVFLDPGSRGRGLGDLLSRALSLDGSMRVWAADDDARSFWVARGFTADGPHALVRAPLRPAASLALFHARTREVLLGRRRVGAYPDHWAFPGGGIEADETARQAAARELFEETTIRLPAGRWLLHTPLTVGDGARAWQLDNYAYALLERPEPRITDELEARWFPLDEALSIAPMASGTRTVLRRILQVAPVASSSG
jgi:8-oxo-dGTP pyrophosphatase MutT (NUDIX family)